MTDFPVSNSAGLTSALASAVGGDTIILAAGTYGAVAITKDAVGVPIVIRSADPRAAILSSLYFNGASLITVEDVLVRGANPNTASSADGQVDVYNGSSNIVLRGCHCKLYDDAAGLQSSRNILISTGCSYVTLDGCKLEGGLRSIVAFDTQSLTITGCEFTDAREGLNFPGCRDVVIHNNYFHDFRLHLAQSDHADMIQCWTSGNTEPAENVEITNNVFDIGSGSWTQTIFARNEWVELNAGGPTKFYKNWKITGNHIRNAHTHGITVGECAGLEISDNIVQWVMPNQEDPYNAGSTPGPMDSVWVPQIIVADAGTGLTVTGNTAYGAPHYALSRFYIPAGATASGNLTYKDNAGPTPEWGGIVAPTLPVVNKTTLTLRVTS